MLLFDSHVHTSCSADGKYSAFQQAEFSIEKGLDGICITDHFEPHESGTQKPFDLKHIEESIAQAKSAALQYEGRIQITSGVELGDYLWGKELSKKLINTFTFDYIITSVHAYYLGHELFEDYKDINSFAKMNSENDIIFLKEYFERTLQTVSDSELDYDCLAHLTYPIRYICSINGREYDINRNIKTIKEIFKILIEKEKSLEINTSCMNSSWENTLPDFNLIKIYYDMGGKIITLGSDAHLNDRLGVGFEFVIEKLKEIGFKQYYIFKKRKPISIPIV